MKFFKPPQGNSNAAWCRYAIAFLTAFVGCLGAIFAFVLLLDPFGVSPMSLPLNRALVTVQRYTYPQVIRSRQFDSLLVGTSTSMLLDPQNLNEPFQARFANLSLAAGTAWEQKTLVDLFLREVKRPKVLVFSIDDAWCEQHADRNRITFRGFPEWLYDDSRWNDYLHLLNRIALMSAIRSLRFHLGLYSPTTRSDGLDTFLPPDTEYDLDRARQHLAVAKAHDRTAFEFPALPWLDEILSRVPSDTRKVIAFMPVHVSLQKDDQAFALCKTRITEIGRQRGATVIDWRIPSPVTQDDSNYWDPLHYRLAIAERIIRDLPEAVLHGKEPEDRAYAIPVR